MRSSSPAAGTLAGAIFAALAIAANPGNSRAQGFNYGAPLQGVQPPALTGVVASAGEGAMEGVVVTARRAGSSIAISVVSDANGGFAFPVARMPEGDYSLDIRAIGYGLTGPATAHVGGGVATVDLAVAPKDEISGELTNTEWLMSVPGSDQQKKLLSACTSCHSLERVVKSSHSSDEFISVLRRMANYVAESGRADIPQKPDPVEISAARLRGLADYLASINQSRGAWTWTLKKLPRPRGAATRVVITEYFLPRDTIAPHDVRREDDGYIWYSNSAEAVLGRLDPRTGENTDFAYPVTRKDMPPGGLDLESDRRGGLWLALMYQSGLARFDRATQRFTLFPVSPDIATSQSQQSMVMPGSSGVDGRVWTNEVPRQALLRLDVESGQYEFIDPFAKSPPGRSHTPYGLVADSGNNLWFMDFGGESIGRVDARTLETRIYPTPTAGSHPRRGMIAAGRLWFAEFGADRLASFDPAREKFTEWPVPTRWSFPYDAFFDGRDLWSGNMESDRILRLNVANGATVEYPLPRPSNIRRVFVDASTNPPTLWAGNNHAAEIIRVEPLD